MEPRARTPSEEPLPLILWHIGRQLCLLSRVSGRCSTARTRQRSWPTSIRNWIIGKLYSATPLLRYCAEGNLQSVLDEYVFQLRSQRPKGALTNGQLWEIAEDMRRALSLTAATLRVRNPGEEDHALAMGTRFAVRYGGGRTEEGAAQRTPEVRAAFNSPFWPFVLTTTSVGQEGIDFHWWCHSVMHWNVPGNPVDFEQREGRVHRYMGHAVRKNVAAAHGTEARAARQPNP